MNTRLSDREQPPLGVDDVFRGTGLDIDDCADGPARPPPRPP